MRERRRDEKLKIKQKTKKIVFFWKRRDVMAGNWVASHSNIALEMKELNNYK
jgi:hypothetical protein